MKKILFSAYSLDIGGIETALVTLLNYLANEKENCDITLVLEEKKGIFLNEINEKIKIIEYMPNKSKNIIKRKAINLTKRMMFYLKYHNKFDFSASFATYSISSSFVSRVSSKNCNLWGHADYLTLFQNDTNEMRKFFNERKYSKFKNIIFVSEEGKESFIKVFPEVKEKVIVCNNLINAEKIIQMSNEDEEELKKIKRTDMPIFVNVGRHDEKQKRLTRLIEAGKILKKQNYKFQIWLIGDGQDTKIYEELVKKYNLENEIIFLGRKKNPYPYMKIAECVVLTSDYEGFPVVFLESLILEKPIITTKVSDYSQIEGKYGYIVEKDSEDIANKMAEIIKNKYIIKEKFDYKKYNNEIAEKIKKLF